MPLRVRMVVPIPFQHGLRNRFAAPAPGAPAPLAVPYIKQEQTNWCWAACCEMVFDFNSVVTVRQCDMATSQFGGNCCVTPSSAVCNQGNWPENVYPQYTFQCLRTNAAFTAAAVQTEINAGRPVEVYYAWTGGGAHVALIIGYYDNGDFEVNDPWYGPGRRTDASVRAAYNFGAWTITYSNLRK
jgi:hypothetical protein